ncbi:hypothetical protein DUNSADRAFT_18474 [Dunaliella salina]|nr:hypothetical protein DUNSADRAFT_18474 [Dunaliella salina]|eukprot:KAF5827940.1 hypothetical protein DUNSADRAFT_18474 [Dunaliella salina]
MLTGRMGRDPEQKLLRTNNILHTTSLAVDDSRPQEQKTLREELEDRPEWVSLAFWGEDWPRTLQEFKKGSWTGVSGTLRQNRFLNRNGDPSLSIEVNVTNIGHIHGQPRDDPQHAEGTDQ